MQQLRVKVISLEERAAMDRAALDEKKAAAEKRRADHAGDRSAFGVRISSGRISYRAGPDTKGTTAEPGETENDIAAQLTKMAELRSNGLLSDEEFSAAKSQLLSLG